MPLIPAERLLAGLEAATATLAGQITTTDQALRVPTCPDWSLRQLATHVGRAHRWGTEIVRTRSTTFIEFRAVPDGKAPEGAAGQAAWLTTGAAGLIAAVRAAGEDAVWAFGKLVPAPFWARRMAHETLVHAADATLATGGAIAIPADLAADAIDEWLTVMSPLVNGQNDLASILPAGTTLGVHLTDADAGWHVTHASDGVRVLPGSGDAGVTLSGRAADVLLVLMRRLPVTTPSVSASGDRALLDRWLELTAF
ncbi:MAG TPA: maleylpyruvate isomerase family mycothiol-dependent enzyme [Streptosporangiaceae bacterium]|nr:maleylpyruvate isomerase family mycothiol-dependent enzyme [Streptosporangiaceae bacterium]